MITMKGSWPYACVRRAFSKLLGWQGLTRGQEWARSGTYYPDYRWVMELILTPSDVEEGPARPEERFALIPASQGFLITGYSGEVRIYDSAGRLVFKKEIKGKTLISLLRPGVYFVVAGKEKARVAVR